MIGKGIGIASFMTVMLGVTPLYAFPGAGLLRHNTNVSAKIDYFCGPGYHIGRGGQRCWPNGRAPIEEIPYGYVVPAPLPAYVANPPPILTCPPGYVLGRGMRRCWAL